MASELKKIRKRAVDLIRMGDKVYHYRKDLLTAEQIQDLRDRTTDLEKDYKDKSTSAETLNQRNEDLHEVLAATGGKIYSNRSLHENLETILVVAIVIVAFRIFFFQPFVIPTSSMYPTYSGMQSKTYEVGEPAPNVAQRVLQKIFRGGTHYQLTAQKDGEIKLPFRADSGRLDFKSVRGRKWLVLPAIKTQFSVYIDNVQHTIQVPAEFRLDEVIIETYKLNSTRNKTFDRAGNTILMNTGIKVKKGDPILQFDILMGDALFVNRFWYHFVQPKSGDAIVFRTESFMDRKNDPTTGLPFPDTVGEDKFYIKRLVGEPGMTLKVEGTRLLQDGKPATGAAAFEKNANLEGEYPGYTYSGLLLEGKSYTVPEDHYFGMGDNSPASKDCRSFGPVPKKKIIGSANFIYYPFTKRWGVAK